MAPFEIGSLASSPEPVLSPDSTVQCELECRRQASEVTNAALGGGGQTLRKRQAVGVCGGPAGPSGRGLSRGRD